MAEGQGLLLKVVSSMLEEVKFLIVVALKILIAVPQRQATTMMWKVTKT